MSEQDALEQKSESTGALRRSVGASRYIIIVPVICTFIGALALVLKGAIETLTSVRQFIAGDIPSKQDLILTFIELADIFLLGTVLYIVSLGLYSLFIDDKIPLPAWLEIHTLDDLKEKLVGVVVVVLGVLFLGQLISWNGQSIGLLYGGGAIALVIAALAFFLGTVGKGHK